jgi:hypothetical protein
MPALSRFAFSAVSFAPPRARSRRLVANRFLLDCGKPSQVYHALRTFGPSQRIARLRPSPQSCNSDRVTDRAIPCVRPNAPLRNARRTHCPPGSVQSTSCPMDRGHAVAVCHENQVGPLDEAIREEDRLFHSERLRLVSNDDPGSSATADDLGDHQAAVAVREKSRVAVGGQTP